MPTRCQAVVDTTFCLDVVEVGREDGSPLATAIYQRAHGPDQRPPATTILLQREWGPIIISPDLRAQLLADFASRALEGWRQRRLRGMVGRGWSCPPLLP